MHSELKRENKYRKVHRDARCGMVVVIRHNRRHCRHLCLLVTHRTYSDTDVQPREEVPAMRCGPSTHGEGIRVCERVLLEIHRGEPAQHTYTRTRTHETKKLCVHARKRETDSKSRSTCNERVLQRKGGWVGCVGGEMDHATGARAHGTSHPRIRLIPLFSVPRLRRVLTFRSSPPAHRLFFSTSFSRKKNTKESNKRNMLTSVCFRILGEWSITQEKHAHAHVYKGWWWWWEK